MSVDASIDTSPPTKAGFQKLRVVDKAGKSVDTTLEDTKFVVPDKEHIWIWNNLLCGSDSVIGHATKHYRPKTGHQVCSSLPRTKRRLIDHSYPSALLPLPFLPRVASMSHLTNLLQVMSAWDAGAPVCQNRPTTVEKLA